eukprot:1179988-Prorocentrum_minimum.AAC.1
MHTYYISRGALGALRAPATYGNLCAPKAQRQATAFRLQRSPNVGSARFGKDFRTARFHRVASRPSYQTGRQKGLGTVAVLRDGGTTNNRNPKWLQKQDTIRTRAERQSAVLWGLRYSLVVCTSAVLVLNGWAAHHIAHGYGLWAIVSCINCNERTQGVWRSYALAYALA